MISEKLNNKIVAQNSSLNLGAEFPKRSRSVSEISKNPKLKKTLSQRFLEDHGNSQKDDQEDLKEKLRRACTFGQKVIRESKELSDRLKASEEEIFLINEKLQNKNQNYDELEDKYSNLHRKYNDLLVRYDLVRDDKKKLEKEFDIVKKDREKKLEEVRRMREVVKKLKIDRYYLKKRHTICLRRIDSDKGMIKNMKRMNVKLKRRLTVHYSSEQLSQLRSSHEGKRRSSMVVKSDSPSYNKSFGSADDNLSNISECTLMSHGSDHSVESTPGNFESFKMEKPELQKQLRAQAEMAKMCRKRSKSTDYFAFHGAGAGPFMKGTARRPSNWALSTYSSRRASLASTIASRRTSFASVHMRPPFQESTQKKRKKKKKKKKEKKVEAQPRTKELRPEQEEAYGNLNGYVMGNQTVRKESNATNFSSNESLQSFIRASNDAKKSVNEAMIFQNNLENYTLKRIDSSAGMANNDFNESFIVKRSSPLPKKNRGSKRKKDEEFIDDDDPETVMSTMETAENRKPTPHCTPRHSLVAAAAREKQKEKEQQKTLVTKVSNSIKVTQKRQRRNSVCSEFQTSPATIAMNKALAEKAERAERRKKKRKKKKERSKKTMSVVSMDPCQMERLHWTDNAEPASSPSPSSSERKVSPPVIRDEGKPIEHEVDDDSSTGGAVMENPRIKMLTRKARAHSTPVIQVEEEGELRQAQDQLKVIHQLGLLEFYDHLKERDNELAKRKIEGLFEGKKGYLLCTRQRKMLGRKFGWTTYVKYFVVATSNVILVFFNEKCHKMVDFLPYCGTTVKTGEKSLEILLETPDGKTWVIRTGDLKTKINWMKIINAGVKELATFQKV